MSSIGPRFWIALGSASAMISVAMGAFGAHALSQRLDPRSLEVFKTGAQYQMTHSLALIAFGLWASLFSARTPEGAAPSLPGWLFVAGILLFSGSLYALTLSGVRALGIITPFGGVAFMAGWLVFAWLAWRG